MSEIVFVDIETTGLDPYHHEIWEVGLIDGDGVEHRWFLPVDLSRADTVALNIGRFHERHPDGHRAVKSPHWESPVSSPANALVFPPARFAEDFARLTWGKHLVGAVVSFDEERLRRLLRRNHQAPGWHYHIVDVEALAIGYIAGCRQAVNDAGSAGEAFWAGTRAWAANEGPLVAPPWKSDQLTAALGITVPEEDKHTALGDARWAKAIYEAVMGE